jgi:predicted DNA-binding protein YlxM (UPF0122 family)
MGYKIRDKKKRNQEIWEYYKLHPDYTMREIGETFGISGARVHVILKGFKSETKQDS